MPLGQVNLYAAYCVGDCSQTGTGPPAVSQVALLVRTVICISDRSATAV